MDQSTLLELVSAANMHFFIPLLTLSLVGVGIYFTIRLGFVQRYLLRAFRQLIGRGRRGKASEAHGMTSLQALTTAAASQVGTGSIVGVSIALYLGGPGVVPWLWVSSLLGMGTIFAEAVLAQIYRREEHGHAIGGPAYYIHYGMGAKWLARIFALLFALALGGIAIMVQANAIADSVSNLLPTQGMNLPVGLGLALLVGIILWGGLRRIAHFSETVVPFMAGAFILVSLIFIGLNYQMLPRAIHDMVYYALHPWAGIGGLAGSSVMAAMRYGIGRGVACNEAGLGSTPHAHAIAQVVHPYEQGLTAMISIALNIIICTMTALVVLTSGVMEMHPEAVGIGIAQEAFASQFGWGGRVFVTVILFFFAFTSIIGLYFFALQNVRYLSGRRFVVPYRLLTLAIIVLGSVMHATLVWEINDTIASVLVMINVSALLYLSPKVVGEGRKIFRQAGKPRQPHPKRPKKVRNEKKISTD